MGEGTVGKRVREVTPKGTNESKGGEIASIQGLALNRTPGSHNCPSCCCPCPSHPLMSLTHTWGGVGGSGSIGPAPGRQPPCTFSQLCGQSHHWKIAISHKRSIYTRKIGKSYKSELPSHQEWIIKHLPAQPSTKCHGLVA